MVFKVKKNPIFVVLTIFLLFLPALIIKDGGLVSIPVTIIPFALGLFLTYALFQSYLIIENQDLVIVYGLIKKRIPIRDIKRLSYTYNPISAPAWTFKRLNIEQSIQQLSSGNVFLSYNLVSAPKNDQSFFLEIKKKNPSVILPN
ncbi:PH domain-containing protein [Peribacillus alkalitolerans]|uniref:PH domain-containing protein n=1 Tax=Peribacillus alkalitolerans TaxID=1550385 RepID=UPI0013D7862A|nr:PH domain-containing protein [Peribacillus alkalitolerans]